MNPPPRESPPDLDPASPAKSSAENPKRISVLGLGLMGTALTERLLEHGYRVTVWNRTRSKADSLLVAGAAWSDQPLREADLAILSLYDSDSVAEVLDRFTQDFRPGLTLVDTTTGAPEPSVSLAARLAKQGVIYLDAPISGSSAQTRRGEATAFVSGDRLAFDALSNLWLVIGKRTIFVGDNGAAARCKLISNLVLGLNRAALAEGLAFAEAMGVDPKLALEALMASAAYSKAMDVKGRKMIDGDYTPQARLSQHHKNVRLILASAERASLALPLSQRHLRLLEEAQTRGWGELDNSAIYEVFRKSRDLLPAPNSPGDAE